jgi:hypothetical protein
MELRTIVKSYRVTIVRWLFVAIVICSAAIPGSTQSFGKLVALGPVSRSGIFDPSVADTEPGQRAWMSYSAVDPSPRWPQRNTRTITTRLAYSDNRGATWTDLGYRINDIAENPGSAAATWNNEITSLVYDRYAPQNERWKLFWLHYLHVEEKGQWQNGWIGYKSAATPPELRSAPELKLFGARTYNRANDNQFGATGAPLGGSPIVKLYELHKDLNLCLVLTEPGAMATASGLYLALSCFQPRVANPIGMLGIGLLGTDEHIILLKCDSPCSPASAGAWKYIGTPLSSADAKAQGFDKYTASDLFTNNGKAYLLVSPVSNKPVGGSYNGCHLFRFANLDTGELEKENGNPHIIQQIEGKPGTFNGACTYASAVTASGFLYGEIRFGGAPYFEIYQTGTGLD